MLEAVEIISGGRCGILVKERGTKAEAVEKLDVVLGLESTA